MRNSHHHRGGFLLLGIVLALFGGTAAARYAFPSAGPATQRGDRAGLLELQQGLRDIASSASPGVVFISVAKVVRVPLGYLDPFDELFNFGFPHGRRGKPREREFRQEGTGSGFLVDKARGYILTNNHVVGEADEILVISHTKKRYDAKVVATDPHTDIAVLQVPRLGDEVSQLTFADSSAVRVGDLAIAIGAPMELPQSLTFGVVSATGRGALNITDYGDFLQTDAAINPGNSGGPLVDLQARVIGMNTAILSQSGGSIGIGFAIPASIVRDVAERLINDGRMTRANLGVRIQELNEALARSFGLAVTQGVLVAQVLPDSPAQRAGLQEGDVLVRLDGQPVTDVDTFRNKVAMAPLDRDVVLGLIRGGKSLERAVRLGEPGGRRDGTKVAADRWGLVLKDLSAEQRRQLGIRGTGILVEQVAPGSSAQRAGLEPGDVILAINRQTIRTVEELRRLDRGERILLQVVREGRTAYVLLQQ